MRKAALKRQLLSLLVGACAFITTVNAIDQTSTTTGNSECSKEALHAYFPEVFVRETFTKFNIPRDKWDSIIKNLNEKDKSVIKIVEEKTSKMDPNPLKDPQQRQVVVKMLRETLMEIFSNELKANGINDDKQITAMLDDIQQQKVKRIAMCIKNEMQAAKEPSSSDDADDADDEDLNDEDDEDEDDEDDDADEAEQTNPVNESK